MVTELPRVSKSVIKVVSLEKDETGAYRPVTIYDKGTRKKTKKQTVGLKQFGDSLRRAHEANLVFERAYLRRHNRSNQKQRDGWLRDFPVNVLQANRKAARVLRISNVF